MSEKDKVRNFSVSEKCPPNVIRREETKVSAKSKQYLDYIPFGDNNLFPQNSMSCMGMYGNCDYFGVCSGQARLDDDSLFRDKETK